MPTTSRIDASVEQTGITKAEWLTYAVGLSVMAALIAGVSALPPLTQSSAANTTTTSPFSVFPGGPAAYCEGYMDGVDCGCFAYKANEVLNTPRTPIQGMAYADRWDLALFQAGDSC